MRPLGATRDQEVDVRVIAATVRNLRREVEEGRFREDLYYRLNVLQINVPPLRDRRDDIMLLVEHFIERNNSRLGTKIRDLDQRTRKLLLNHPWPGNVRELEHAIERAIALAGGSDVLQREHILGSKPIVERRPEPGRVTTLSDAVAEAEQIAIRAALDHTRGRKAEAARILGISRKNLWEKMKHSGMDAGPPDA